MNVMSFRQLQLSALYFHRGRKSLCK